MNSPINSETRESLPLNIFRKGVHDYIKTRPNKVVNLNEMGRYFYGDDSPITAL